jgi:hypothetical protein
MEDNKKDNREITWTDELEDLLKTIAEKSNGFSWLHAQSELKFSKLNNWISIPVIILSTIAGSASVGVNNFGDTGLASVIIGCVSIGTGILSTIGSYFAYSRRAESHRITSISYKKLHRFISIELALPRNQRMPPKVFLKTTRETIDRLIDIQPPISEDVIEKFKNKFIIKNENHSAIPDECNGLDPVNINKKIEKNTTFADILNNIKRQTSLANDLANFDIRSSDSAESSISSPTNKISLEIGK